MYSTYLGGSDFEQGCALAVDAAGNMFVALTTPSTDMPGTAGSPIQPANGGGFADGYVTEIAASGRQQLWATYLGGTDNDRLQDDAWLPASLTPV